MARASTRVVKKRRYRKGDTADGPVAVLLTPELKKQLRELAAKNYHTMSRELVIAFEERLERLAAT